MPRIFDNIEQKLLDALQETLKISERADFCVGYFNLRGWRYIDRLMENWQGNANSCCRLLIGMHETPEGELRKVFSLRGMQDVDQSTVVRLKTRIAQEFREQLLMGAPSNADQEGLRRLSAQLRAKRVIVKLFLHHKLHAKLYLLYLNSHITPIVGYLGSSNLTLAGLMQQGELNVDVVDSDACKKLERWFIERWEDRWCLDISEELADIIDESWAREEMPLPYYIYLKMAYHLSQEARAGLQEFNIPRDFKDRLFEFQVAAVKIAAHHLNKRDGVLIGDVVGLGKTLMATALARIFQDDHDLETLIICPKNLVKMWEDYVAEYRLVAKVLSVTRVISELPELRRYRVVLIDESHNLRNREGRRYRAIQEYLTENESRCILLSATPYNKTYRDLSNQLRLFVPDDRDIGVRPERLLQDIGETEFVKRYQCPVRSLAGFEKSTYADDWRELMRLYMVRRTRTFIQENYAKTDPTTGRKFLTFEDGTRSYFPERVPKTVKVGIDEKNPADQYARLYAPEVVAAVNALNLPRYGLANYVAATPHKPPTPAEAKQLQDLSRAGKRLMGFCRTNLFKRLESSGEAFQQSLERHVLRNYIFLHAIENDLPLPLGTQDAGLLDTASYDEDLDDQSADAELFSEGEDETVANTEILDLHDEAAFQARAAETYRLYATQYKRRFKWLRADLFVPQLKKDLTSDSARLLKIIDDCGQWNPTKDTKLTSLIDVLTKRHPQEKIIVFSQFADTVRYLERRLKSSGIKAMAAVSGETSDPTSFAWRFSPVSNNKRDEIGPDQELRVLIATDVLSEGQNLQDSAIIVNYDLPWAIIRLIQRAGRVDRIGQKSDKIYCHSFLPADGVERIIQLRRRVRQRLRENAEVVGSDEAFFEDETDEKPILDLYNEKSSILEESDNEVDLASF